MGLQNGGVGGGEGSSQGLPLQKKGVCGKGFSHAEGGGGRKKLYLVSMGGGGGGGGPAMYPICSHPPLPVINDRL